ncbi:pyrroline-5-carboxylate reductase [Geomicrobium sp. JCM 19039]|uniref:pyrroline-5-carboxylate reductase n=1 Tax=Geomicrobium sp. JCM 19039 TaxID=1460636 RepID=UPI0005A82215|nr:pyrroline-5-carboxylate reductase [Geomicrobium sp. JCM 19039]
MMHNKRLLFVGAGAMAEAIISGIRLAEQQQSDIRVINRSDETRLSLLNEKYNIDKGIEMDLAVAEADMIILATKPKDMASAIDRIQPYVEPRHLIISVLAGITTQTITNHLGKNNPIIRAMPNTSANVLQSATAVCKGDYASEYDLSLATALFETIGSVIHVEETQMDAVTGISGSGPAYMYYMMEGLQQTALQNGLNKDEAKKLIVQTVLGAAMRWTKTDASLESLYKEVMSPGGTTEAAFVTLEENEVQRHFSRSVQAAIERSKQLGS